MEQVLVESGRTTDFTVPIKTASGGYLQLAATDTVRFKLGRGTQTPDIDVVSGTATANGSSVTIDQRGDGSATHASVTIRLAQGDTSSLYGPYDGEVSVVDDSETAPANAIKCAEKVVVHVVQSMGGDVGLS